MRDLQKTVDDTNWMILLMQRMKQAVWTLEEDVPVLCQLFRRKYLTCRVFEMHNHCRLAQSRRRFVISSHEVLLRPLETPPVTVRDLLRKSWGGKQVSSTGPETPFTVFVMSITPCTPLSAVICLLVLSMLVISQVSTT